jgi:hypothetical protein
MRLRGRVARRLPRGVAAARDGLSGRTASLLLAACLPACVFVPRTTHVYDPECRIEARQMVLELHQVAGFGGCVNEGCVALLVAAGTVTAASAVVSGSIALAGNVVYWFERRGACAR